MSVDTTSKTEMIKQESEMMKRENMNGEIINVNAY